MLNFFLPTFAVTEDDAAELEESGEEYPFISKRSALSVFTDVNKRGIVEECCLKSCSLAELQSYCR